MWKTVDLAKNFNHVILQLELLELAMNLIRIMQCQLILAL